MSVIRSRDNPRVKRWARLARDGGFRRREQRALLEGPHLVGEYMQRGTPITVLATEEGLSRPEIHALLEGKTPVMLSQAVFMSIVDADNPPGVAAEIEIPRARAKRNSDCVFLEGVQDAGNVGAIIRSAAAFGIGSVILDRACADPWSPKVLRAAMGGHFSLSIIEGEAPCGRLICTVPRGGTSLGLADLSGPLCWAFGSEGKGLSPALQSKAAQRVSIPISQGTESLNVAAAAAICLYETFSRRAAGS